MIHVVDIFYSASLKFVIEQSYLILGGVVTLATTHGFRLSMFPLVLRIIGVAMEVLNVALQSAFCSRRVVTVRTLMLKMCAHVVIKMRLGLTW